MTDNLGREGGAQPQEAQGKARGYQEGEPLQADATLLPVPEHAPSSDHLQQLNELREERDRLIHELEEIRGFAAVGQAAVMAEAGIYQYRHPLDNAAQYQDELTRIQEETRELIRSGNAIQAAERFMYNNSLAQGRRMVTDFSKLMLRAYNAEADNCVRTVRAGSVSTAIDRLNRAVSAIEKLGKFMDMHVTELYHRLRLREIELTGDYLVKVQEEKEAERARREELREQRRAEEELAAQRRKLEKERSHYENALASLASQGKADQGEEIVARLKQIEAAIEENDYRRANIRAGYVYVISNIGAFGQNVVKIGMTRRLDPMDRVRELGDASVPFPFDVHLIHFSDDAAAMEADLHTQFADRRLNAVNLRREFFGASPSEVREVLLQKFGNILEFVEEPEALQYRQSLGILS